MEKAVMLFVLALSKGVQLVSPDHAMCSVQKLGE